MSAPDPRRTEDAVRQVRAVWPSAFMRRHRLDDLDHFWTKRHGKKLYTVEAVSKPGLLMRLGIGNTPKEAWWAAVPKALAAALTGEKT